MISDNQGENSGNDLLQYADGMRVAWMYDSCAARRRRGERRLCPAPPDDRRTSYC